MTNETNDSDDTTTTTTTTKTTASVVSPTNCDFISESPARLCLFGEHSDYLGFPVIAGAIPLYCRIFVQKIPQSPHTVILRIPQNEDEIREYRVSSQQQEEEEIVLVHSNAKNNNNNNSEKMDFALACLKEATLEWGPWKGDCGVDCLSMTEFPMQAGISSSSAFCVALMHVLAVLWDKYPLEPLELAKLAHRAEVTHFGAPGGTMDHVTCAVGGFLRIGPGPWDIESLTWNHDNNDEEAQQQKQQTIERRGVFVLAYSGEPKDTMKHLFRCKNMRLALLQKLGGQWPFDDDDDDNADDNNNDNKNTNNKLAELSEEEVILLETTRVNRQAEWNAYQHWSSSSNDDDGYYLAQQMQRHHNALRDGLHLSTIRLEAMNQAAMAAGAWGFKVVGSGGGGCAVAWTPISRAATVAHAMEQAGATQTWIFSQPASGAKIVGLS